MDRRQLLKSLAALTGSATTARLLLDMPGVSAPLSAQAANAATETVKYPSGSIQVEGFVAKPAGTGKFPAVLIISENRGLNDQIRDVAKRLAGEGFVALAPDVLSRVGGVASMKTPNEAVAAVGRLPIPETLGDLREGFTFLSKRPDVDPAKISVIGFGWGGWRTWMLASQVPELKHAVVYYGMTPDRGMENVKASVQAHYASRDRAITGNSQWTAREMKKLGKQFTFFIYDDTDAQFFNETVKARYSPEASKLAWSRTVQFLKS